MAPSQLPPQARMQISAQELRDISLQISRDFAPRRFRAATARKVAASFSPRELLAISQQISREYAPRNEANRGAAKLVALPVDPGHLHVYWQLDAPPATATEMTADQATDPTQPLILRVFTEMPATVKPEPAQQSVAPAPLRSTPSWFDVPVNTDRNQQQIALPSPTACIGGLYQVAIGRLNEHQEFRALAISNHATAPQTAPANNQRLPPTIAAFIMGPTPASSASSAPNVNASGSATQTNSAR